MRRYGLLLLATSLLVLAAWPLLAVSIATSVAPQFSSSAPHVSVTVDPASGGCSILVGGQLWLSTGDIFVHINERYYSVANKSLTLAAPPVWQQAGEDVLGAYQLTAFTWTTADSLLSFVTSYRVYQPERSSDSSSFIPYIVFSQQWLSVSGGPEQWSTSTGNPDDVLTCFPSFDRTLTQPALGAYQWGESFLISRGFAWSGANATLGATGLFPRGRAAGPLVLFDTVGRANGTTVVYSQLSEFMATSVVPNNVTGVLETGVLGSMYTVPAGFKSESILTFSGDGLTAAMLQWGDALLLRYGRDRATAFEQTQTTTAYIGYSTDNGAYYYVRPDNTIHSPHSTANHLQLCSLVHALAVSLPFSTTPRTGRATSKHSLT